ncbi:hypothetical protein KYE75_07675 [Bifidobacterium pseudocatenulatum]|uniref:hypothetical protein n=1 Tax=Bifidobacterium pseudocatenulatum TaxID=28026 RepID=UPI001CFB96D3|nr:hypothetical protein [Bifidobacterium pseudocatenulatum]MCB4890607.1 hypothetical protein [Bifidobacterium pseudocatenulatum]MCB4905798.1 hypothetical protein [Bifidobacterium pseudocatenulatum]MCB4912362.1 hypothetical protein [Bifidobacterium pseudocatenulatum]UDG91407.1 hypothetical protein KYE75_07675 [Bifidobacterium pseudocatenulatum]
MTKINFDFGKPSAGGIVDLSNATVSVIPTERFRNDSRIVVREGFEVALDAKGKATVTVPPTDNTFCYEVTVGLDKDLWKFRRYVNVPDSTTAVEFADLVDVDSDTLAPALNTGAALTYLLASSLQDAQALSAANPGQMVFYPEGQAKTVASQILEDLTGARAVVESQSAAAAQAANAAQASAVGAQAASVQAADAVQAVSEQTAQVSANAAVVQSVADSISESKSVVESHANEALTAIDEAVKSVKDKASDVSGEDRTDTVPTDSTDSASSQEA